MQGFHDIVSVFLLVLDDEALAERCVERMSLHRIRDSMCDGLEPVIAYLRLMKRILRAADPAFADLVDGCVHACPRITDARRASALPYFSLSWVLTLLAHDVATLDAAARVFDILLAHNPAFVCYLAVAIVLGKRDEIAALEGEDADDPAMLHSTLGKLPALSSGRAVVEPRPEPVRRESVSGPALSAEALMDPDVITPAFVDPPRPAPTAPAPPPSLPIEPLIQHALDLQSRYPLDHASIAADELLGPRSAVFTWSLDGASPPTLSDEEAERVVAEGGDQVVRPPPVDVPTPDEAPPPSKRRSSPAQPALSVLLAVGVLLLAMYGPEVILAGVGRPGGFASVALRWLRSVQLPSWAAVYVH